MFRASRILSVLGVLACSALHAQAPYKPGDRLTPAPSAAAAAKPAASERYRTITWEELLPKDWNPLKEFQGTDLGLLRDNDPRAEQLLQRMRAAWDNAPLVTALDGATIRIPGFIVPLETSRGGLTEFLLVPYFGGCIHSPPPPANQIVHVVAPQPVKGFVTMDAVWVSGVLKADRRESAMGTSGYSLRAASVERYERAADSGRR